MNELDKLALINNECSIKTKIILDNGIVLTESDCVLSWDYEDFRYVPNQGFIGQFVERVVNGKFKNVDDSFTLENKILEIQFAVVRNDGTETWYSLGNFIVNDPTDDNVSDNTSFKAVDYTKYFETAFVNKLSYPTTAGALAYNVCRQAKTHLGNFEASLTKDKTLNTSKQYFTYDSVNDAYNLVTEPITSDLSKYYEINECFTNHDFVIDNNQFINNESCRTVMKAIGMLAYSWVRIGWDNKCYLDFNVNDQVLSENTITNDNYYDLTTKNDYFGAINKVVIGMKDVEGENVSVTMVPTEITWDGNPAGRETIPMGDTMFCKVSDIGLSIPDLIGQEMTGVVDTQFVETNVITINDIDDLEGNGEHLIVRESIAIFNTPFTIEDVTYSTGVYFMVFPAWNMYISKLTLPENLSSSDVSSSDGEFNEIALWDNPLTYTQELRQKAIAKANKLFGLKYKPVELTTTGNPWLIGNELLEIIDMEGNSIFTYPFDRTISYSGHIKTKIKSQALSKTDTKYTYEGAINVLNKNIKNTQIIVDKANQRIDAVVESNEKNTKQISAINLSLEGISSTVNSTTQTVKNLEDSIDYFSVDLAQYNLTIPTDSSNKPTETKNYDIPFYAYLKGKQITPNVTIQNSYTGITASKTNTYLKFAVSNATSITKELNEYNIVFQFIDGATTYSLTKKINIALAKAGVDGINGKDGYTPVKGKDYFDGENGQDGYTPVKGKDYFDGIDGDDGLSAYQIWLNAGNSGTEADYLTSLKGAPGTPGAPGKDGTSTYFYVRYSANSNGNPMVATPSSTTKYMGVASTTSSTAPTSYSAYTWNLIKGADGKDGIGKDGENGLTSYLHIKYSQDGVTFTEAMDGYALGEKPSAWIGQYVDYTKEDSTNFDDYEWYKFTEDIDEDLANMREEIDQANENASNNYTEIVQLKTDIAQTDEKIDFNVQQLSQTIVNNNQNLQNEINDINSSITNGVETLRNTLVTIDIDGIKVATNLSKISTIMTNDTFAVMSGETRLAYFGYDENAGRSIAEMDNLTVTNYFTAGYHRTEGFEDKERNELRTGWFYVGGNI